MQRKYRQWGFCILAGITYLIIHEGTHIIQALIHNIFEGIHFNGVGVEVLITEPLTIGGLKLACFSGLSSVVTILIGYLIYMFTPDILSSKNQFIKSYFYYVGFVFLILDPLYLAVFSFLVGGDINGIAIGLNIPYMAIRIIAFMILCLNLYIIVKKLYPKYTQNFKKGN